MSASQTTWSTSGSYPAVVTVNVSAELRGNTPPLRHGTHVVALRESKTKTVMPLPDLS